MSNPLFLSTYLMEKYRKLTLGYGSYQPAIQLLPSQSVDWLSSLFVMAAWLQYKWFFFTFIDICATSYW